MKKVFADKVLTEYTYYGLRNKKIFSVLSINKAIFGNLIIIFWFIMII